LRCPDQEQSQPWKEHFEFVQASAPSKSSKQEDSSDDTKSNDGGDEEASDVKENENSVTNGVGEAEDDPDNKSGEVLEGKDVKHETGQSEGGDGDGDLADGKDQEDPAHLISEGYLMKMAGVAKGKKKKKWQSRYFVIEGSMLIYYPGNCNEQIFRFSAFSFRFLAWLLCVIKTTRR
jgi:hypothetical protein